jgi:hypothetical protein
MFERDTYEGVDCDVTTGTEMVGFKPVLDNPSIFPTVVLELKAFVMLACNTQEIPLRM